ncbi:MAG: tannase/feruloyl esterase family alpha/beta hydrolase [Bryobacteraceae bacterium]
MKRLCQSLAFATCCFAAGDCAKLTALAIPHVTIESAEISKAGAVESCKVKTVARPVADSEIHIEVWMPASGWNGKFLGTGNGGYSSAMTTPMMTRAVEDGYATAGHDTGHTGGDLRFGFGHPEKVKDYAFRAVHTMTAVAKLVVHAYLGRFPDHAYFSSCSAGGHQALSEVQRYPEDYDGVIAGAPANNRLRQTFGFIWSWRALHDDAGAPLVTADQLRMVTTAAVEACDGADGVRDGLIDDPRRCGFDAGSLACDRPGAPAAPRCLSQPQIEGIRKVWAGLRSPRNGERIFAGFPKGTEAFGDAPQQSWRAYLLDPAEPMRAEALRYFLFHDPAWDWRTVDYDRDLAFADRELSFMNATAKDLSPFAARGGKLLLYAGWSDPIVPAEDTIAYYDAVTKAMGGAQKTQAFARLFVAPGMAHCAGGPGPNQFDSLGAMDRWVTRGEAPQKLIASHTTAGKVDRTRPLCPYPMVARYRGSGSTGDAANFTCVAPPK